MLANPYVLLAIVVFYVGSLGSPKTWRTGAPRHQAPQQSCFSLRTESRGRR